MNRTEKLCTCEGYEDTSGTRLEGLPGRVGSAPTIGAIKKKRRKGERAFSRKGGGDLFMACFKERCVGDPYSMPLQAKNNERQSGRALAWKREGVKNEETSIKFIKFSRQMARSTLIFS